MSTEFITPAVVYAIGILDNVTAASGGMMFMAGFVAMASIIWMFCALDSGSTYHIQNAKRMLLGAICIFLIFGAVHTLLPSTRLAAAMLLVPAIANNEDVQQIGGNSLEALRKLTEQWLIELQSEKPKSKEL